MSRDDAQCPGCGQPATSTYPRLGAWLFRCQPCDWNWGHPQGTTHDYVFFCSYNDAKQDWDDGAHPAINCNDIFYPAADAEALRPEEVEAYVQLCREFKDDAAPAWVSVVRHDAKPWRGFEINEAAKARARELISAHGIASRGTSTASGDGVK